MKRVKDLKVGDFCYAISPIGVVVKLKVNSIDVLVEDKVVVSFDKGFIGIGYKDFCSLDIHHTDAENLCGYGLLKNNTKLVLDKETAIETFESMIERMKFCIEKLNEE